MVDLSLMPGLLSNDSSICFGEKKERKTICSSIVKHYMLMFAVIHHGVSYVIGGVETIPFPVIATPRPLALGPASPAPGWPCQRQRLIGAPRPFTHISFFLPHLPAFAAVVVFSCIHSLG